MKVEIIKIRIQQEFLYEDQKLINKFLETHDVVKTETAFVPDEQFWTVLVYYNEIDFMRPKTCEEGSKTIKYLENEILSKDEIKIVEALKLWRSEKAKEQNLPSYCIATNKELLLVAKFRPDKKEQLLNIKGFGKHKIENYGYEILKILETV